MKVFLAFHMILSWDQSWIIDIAAIPMYIGMNIIILSNWIFTLLGTLRDVDCGVVFDYEVAITVKNLIKDQFLQS